MKLDSGSQPDIDSPIQTVHPVKDDLIMRFEIDKCRVLVMRRGKEFECKGITIGCEEVMYKIDDDCYKSLGIMKRSDIFEEQMKRRVKTEYFKRVRSALKSKLNAGNVFKAIYIWTVATVQYDKME